jgi:hypothetical protein
MVADEAHLLRSIQKRAEARHGGSSKIRNPDDAEGVAFHVLNRSQKWRISGDEWLR